MESPEPDEHAVPQPLLQQLQQQLDLVSELATKFTAALGKNNMHAKRMAVLKLEFESVYAAMTKSQTAEELVAEDVASLEEELDVGTSNRARKIGVKSSARLNTNHLDNINFYIRHLQSEQEIYLLYEFFDLIVAKVKEYGAYDPRQIWEGIKSEPALLNNIGSAQNIRDILDNHELQEGLSLYATFLREQQARKAG